MNRIYIFICISLLCHNLNSQDIGLPDHFKVYSQKYNGQVFWKGSLELKELALTFDDGPSPATSLILDLLEKHQVKATFFWQGRNLIKYPDIVKRAIELGHELGNHSWDHPNCSELSPDVFWKNQLLPTFKVYDSLYNLQIDLYRPPFGAISEEQLAFLSKHDVNTIFWSVSSLDWDTTRNSSREIIQRFEAGLHDGAVILFHDVDFNKSLSDKLKAIEEIIILAKNENYIFSEISNLVKLSP